MLQDVADASKNQGLKMSMSKKNVIIENDTPIYIDNTQIENVERYNYLGQIYSTRDKNQGKDIQRRITPDGKHSQRSSTPSRLILEQA